MALLPRNYAAATVLCVASRGICLVGAVLAISGCTVCQQARRTSLDEPAQFSSKRDQERTLTTYRLWAESAWRQERASCPTDALDEYGLGFRDGFVDYVYAGGSGEPPPVPPRKFWNVMWRNPAGHAAAADWFAGYRHGAHVARDGGYRKQAVVISSLGPYLPEGAHIGGEYMLSPPEAFSSPLPPQPEDLGPPPTQDEVPSKPAPSSEKAPATPATPEEAPDTLPDPSPAEPDLTAQVSAAQFRTVLRSAASRGGARFVAPSFKSAAQPIAEAIARRTAPKSTLKLVPQGASALAPAAAKSAEVQ